MRTLSLLPALGTLALSSLGGCIIYEKDVVHVGGEDCGPHEDCADWGWYDTGDTASGDPGTPDEPELSWLFTPNTLAPGETAILSLTADAPFDYGTIAEVDLYGDATVCAIDTREAEVLVTASAFSEAMEGSTVNALIITVDGEGIWVEDALTITGGANQDPDGSGGGDDGSDPGTGDDGSDPSTGDGGTGGSGDGTGCGG